MQKVFLASDHRGFELKNELSSFLRQQNDSYQVIDLGAEYFDAQDDYNDYAVSVAKQIQNEVMARGILICGSAHGIAIQANRFLGVRAIEALNPESAKIGRLHNDANILCLSADFMDFELAKQITQAFLETEFSNEERHQRRIRKIDDLAKEEDKL